MKNIRFTAVLLALLMMTGCSEDKKTGEAPVQDTAAQTEYVMQDGDTQVTGEVTSIVGNEVTLALGEVTENEKENRGGEKPADGEMPEMPEGGFSNGEMPEGFGGGNMKGGRGGSAAIEKSGETASYTIPVGMTISGASGRNSDYSAISAGMVLRLTLNSDGYVVAAEII